MIESLKARVARRVMHRLRELEQAPDLDRTRCETALRRRGMQPGNAQRLLDEGSDVQLGRLEEVARLLGVPVVYLLDDQQPLHTAPEWPLRMVSLQQWEDLNERERGAIDHAAQQALRDVLAARPSKRSSAAFG